MGFFQNLFGGHKLIVVTDLTKPYRELLATQTDDVVRGVLVRAIVLMDEIEHPDATMRPYYGEKHDVQLGEIQRRQDNYTSTETALSAMTLVVNSIVMKSAGELLYGDDTVIRNISGSEEIKKAAMCYAFACFICTIFLASFKNAKAVSEEDLGKISRGWREDLLAPFALASQEQRIEIDRRGMDMLNGLMARKEPNVMEFLKTFRELTWIAAMNWESKKVPDEKINLLFKQKMEVLLGALA